MSEKRRKQKKNGQSDKIPEDEPAAYNKALWVVVTKVCHLFCFQISKACHACYVPCSML